MMLLDNECEPFRESKEKYLLTPFTIVSTLLVGLCLYLAFIEFILKKPSPHTIGVIAGVLNLLLAIIFFGIDRVLRRRMKYKALCLFEGTLFFGIITFLLI